YWLRAQAAHDTEVASAELAEEIERIEPLVGSTAAASLAGQA
ncbi:MAG: addiction module antidote protein, HigA family, partial [Synechococcaceae bacterium WB9_2_112]|nr:addiction module antidote protein, HigA family [Synechococcaceae bacterium WB9_2_112]